MTTKPFFSGRIPQDLYDALEEYRERTNESKTEILVKALSSYVDHPMDQQSLIQFGEAEIQRIDSLEKRFETLEQELHSLRNLFTTKVDSSEVEQPTQGIEEETVDQAPSILKDVIRSDNEIDNSPDSSNEGEETSDNYSDNKLDNEEKSLPHKVLVGTLKTLEILELPGLEGLDPKKLKSKVNNTKRSKSQTAQIGSYTIVFSDREEVPDRKKQELFWDVYKDENEPNASVISSDNINDN